MTFWYFKVYSIHLNYKVFILFKVIPKHKTKTQENNS